MKQEQARSNPEGESYKDGMNAGWSIQLVERGSWTARLVQLTCVQLARSVSWTDPTRRMGELVGASSLTHRMGELVGASGPTRPFSELDDGCLSGIRCPRLFVTFLEDLSCEHFSELLRTSI